MSVIAGLAPAKINLTLRVVCRRADGYHEVDSVVAFLDLCDSLLFRLSPTNIQELCVTGRAENIPVDGGNLVLRAAEALTERVGRDLPFTAVLDKRIPAGTGLGGGSSDAATTLLILNELHDLDVSPAALAEAGAAVGSDVPMFLQPDVAGARIRGRGERVEPLAGPVRGHCLLILPGIHISTPAVYAAWDREPVSTQGQAEVPWAEAPRQWLEGCFNDLQPAAFRLFPELQSVQRKAADICGRPVLLTGSGSALFSVFDDPAHAGRMAARIAEEVNVETLVAPFRSRAGNQLPEVQHADY